MSKKSLLDLIDEKIEEARARKAAADKARANKEGPAQAKSTPATRAAVNKANAQKSTGPKSERGKAAVSQNSLEHGFFADIQRLDPADAPTFQNLLADFRQGMHPDGPVEDLSCREGMSTGPTQQLLRRSSVVRSKDAFALIMGNIDGPPATTEPPLSPGRQSGDRPALYLYDDFNEGQPLDYAIDSRDLAQAFTAAGDALDRVHKIETHLRRAYNRPSDRLQRLQRDRLRPPYSNPGALRDPLRNPSSFTPAYRPGDPLPNPGSSPGLSPENPKQQNKPTPCHPLHSQPETGTNSTAASSQPSAPPARLNRRSGAQHLHGRTRFAIAEEGNKAVAQTSGSAPARRQGK